MAITQNRDQSFAAPLTVTPRVEEWVLHLPQATKAEQIGNFTNRMSFIVYLDIGKPSRAMRAHLQSIKDNVEALRLLVFNLYAAAFGRVAQEYFPTDNVSDYTFSLVGSGRWINKRTGIQYRTEPVWHRSTIIPPDYPDFIPRKFPVRLVAHGDFFENKQAKCMIDAGILDSAKPLYPQLKALADEVTGREPEALKQFLVNVGLVTRKEVEEPRICYLLLFLYSLSLGVKQFRVAFSYRDRPPQDREYRLNLTACDVMSITRQFELSNVIKQGGFNYSVPGAPRLLYRGWPHVSKDILRTSDAEPLQELLGLSQEERDLILRGFAGRPPDTFNIDIYVRPEANVQAGTRRYPIDLTGQSPPRHQSAAGASGGRSLTAAFCDLSM